VLRATPAPDAGSSNEVRGDSTEANQSTTTHRIDHDSKEHSAFFDAWDFSSAVTKSGQVVIFQNKKQITHNSKM